MAKHPTLTLSVTLDLTLPSDCYALPVPKVLLIGLGSGSLLMALADQGACAAVTALDLEPAMPWISQEHFGLTLPSPPHATQHTRRCWPQHQTSECPSVCNGPPRMSLAFVCGDAAELIAQGDLGAQYQLVIVDAFDGEDVPLSVGSAGFISRLHRVLRPQRPGLVLANLHTGVADDDEASERCNNVVFTYACHFQCVFTISCPTAANVIIAAFHGMQSVLEAHEARLHEMMAAIRSAVPSIRDATTGEIVDTTNFVIKHVPG